MTNLSSCPRCSRPAVAVDTRCTSCGEDLNIRSRRGRDIFVVLGIALLIAFLAYVQAR